MTEGLKTDPQDTVKKPGIACRHTLILKAETHRFLGLPASLGEVQTSERLYPKKIKDGWCSRNDKQDYLLASICTQTYMFTHLCTNMHIHTYTHTIHTQ